MILNNKVATVIRLISNIALIFFNSFVTIILFSQFGSSKGNKIIWTALGIMIVFIQVYSLMQLKGAKGKKRFSPLLAYAIATVFSVVGTVGFTLSEIALEKKDQAVSITIETTTEDDINYYKKKIDGYNRDIEVLRLDNEKEKTPAWKRSENNTTMKNLQDSLSKTEKLWNEAKARRITVKTEDAKEIKVSSTFDYIAEAISFIPKLKVSGESLKNFLMLLLSFVFEYFVFYTAEPLKEKEEDIKEIELKEEKKENNNEDTFDKHFNTIHNIGQDDYAKFKTYIEALYATNNNESLNSNEAVIKIAPNLNTIECDKYKKALCQMFWKKTPLLVEKNGKLSSKFSKEDILKVITFKFNFQD